MSKPTKVIVSVTNDLFTDQRVDKVCLFLTNTGFDVTLIGRVRKNSMQLAPRKYKTKRMHLLFDKGVLFYANYNLALFFRLLFSKTDVLLSNDLDTLLANYIASKFKRKCILVYDTHEYFTEVPELIYRPKVKAVWEKLEAWIFPKLNHIYTVNKSIATQYKTKYRKELKVVRNVAPSWKPKDVTTKSDLGIPENKFILIAQGAGINIDRGIEELCQTMIHLDNCCLLIVGDGDALPSLKLQVEKQKSANVLFFGKRAYNEMMNFTFHADLGFSLDKDTNLNYRFSLPNKIFDYIQASTPIFATRLPEIEKIIQKYDLGFICDTLDPRLMANEINDLLLNTERLNQLKLNCKHAALIECWEHEIPILESIYLPLKNIN